MKKKKMTHYASVNESFLRCKKTKTTRKELSNKVMTERSKEKTKVMLILRMRSKEMIELMQLKSQKLNVDKARKRDDLLQTS